MDAPKFSPALEAAIKGHACAATHPVAEAHLREAIRAEVEAKCRETLILYGDGFLYVGMSDDGRPEYDMVKMDELIARVMGPVGTRGDAAVACPAPQGEPPTGPTRQGGKP